MADVTVTPANVARISGADPIHATAGEAITAGELVYKDASDGLIYVASDDDADKDEVAGIALNTAEAAGQPVTYQWSGVVTPGGTLTVGTIYVLSASGAFSPAADKASNEYVSTFGIALTTANLQIGINNSGVQVP